MNTASRSELRWKWAVRALHTSENEMKVHDTFQWEAELKIVRDIVFHPRLTETASQRKVPVQESAARVTDTSPGVVKWSECL